MLAKAHESLILSVTQTPSDMIVVSGLYNALTLCVYGNVAPPPEAVEAQFPQASSRKYVP